MIVVMAVYRLSLIITLIGFSGIAGAQTQSALPPPSPDQIRQFESQVQSDPEDAAARMALIDAYQHAGQGDKAIEQMLWIIRHHPEWNTQSILTTIKGIGNELTAADYRLLKTAWEKAIADHPNNPEVLYNAGELLELFEGERALQLFRQARQLQPSSGRYLQAIASIYETAIVKEIWRQMETSPGMAAGPVPLSPQWEARLNAGLPAMLSAESAARLTAELPALHDAALLSQVGRYLAETSSGGPDNPKRQLGMRLLERAIVLEPDNPRWSEALTEAKYVSPPPPPPPSPSPAGPMRIGTAVAEANLIRKVQPIYPALAQEARVSGTVEFTAVIGTEGHIQNLQLTRGHPLLVSAARDAVLQYMYRPTLLNGNPVPVVTNIAVSFELPAQ